MPVSALGCELEVARGPNWLLVRVKCLDPHEPALPLAEEIWALMQKHFIYRVVLELDELPRLSSNMLEQLNQLYQRVKEHEGLLRLCGLSPYNRQVLRAHKLDRLLPSYRNRQEAILGRHSPFHPR